MKLVNTAAKFLLLLGFGLLFGQNANAATNPPKVVFIGDAITYGWTNIVANPNWINEGVPDISPNGAGSSGGVLARFQSGVVSLHPNVVHIMVGPADADVVYDSGYQFYVPGFLNDLDAMVKASNYHDL